MDYNLVLNFNDSTISGFNGAIMSGKSIRLHLVDGTPGGMKVAEIINWTGHVIQAPRSSLKDLLSRPEVSRSGVYILTGDDPDQLGQPLAYIGESDIVDKRLRQHNLPESSGGKDFWNKVTVITSKDHNLTKGHVRYLESQLVGTALIARRANLQNQIIPSPPPLPEADISDMSFFLEQIKIILPVLGLDLLREVIVSTTSDSNAPQLNRSPIFNLKATKIGLQATAQEVDNEFIVIAGSQARGAWAGSSHGYKVLRQKLIDEGKLIPDQSNPSFLMFVENTPFSSPSAASATIWGRSDNGRTSWVTEDDGRTYAQWQEDMVPSEDPDI